MSKHFKILCRNCESVVSQCRCPDNNKLISYVQSCSKCVKNQENVEKQGSTSDSNAPEKPELNAGMKKQSGKTAIQSFADWLSMKDGREDFAVSYSEKAFIIRRIDKDEYLPDRPLNQERE